MQLIWDETSRRLLFILSYLICWVFSVASMLPSQTDGTCMCVTNERPAQPREEKKLFWIMLAIRSYGNFVNETTWNLCERNSLFPSSGLFFLRFGLQRVSFPAGNFFQDFQTGWHKRLDLMEVVFRLRNQSYSNYSQTMMMPTRFFGVNNKPNKTQQNQTTSTHSRWPFVSIPN